MIYNYEKITLSFGKNESKTVIINFSYEHNIKKYLLVINTDGKIYEKAFDKKDVENKKGIVRIKDNVFSQQFIKYQDDDINIRIINTVQKQWTNYLGKIDKCHLLLNGFGLVSSGIVKYFDTSILMAGYKMISLRIKGDMVPKNYILSVGHDFNRYDGIYILVLSNFTGNYCDGFFLFELHGKIVKIKGEAKTTIVFENNSLKRVKLKMETSKKVLLYDSVIDSENKTSELSSSISQIRSMVSVETKAVINIKNYMDNKELRATSMKSINDRIMYL